MRISVDPDLCTGHGRCYALAPDLFDADDDGYCVPGGREIAPGREDEARLGVDSCPEGAIKVVG